MKKSFLLIALFSSLLAAVPSAQAITYYNWNNTGTYFNLGSSWDSGLPPDSSASHTPEFNAAAVTQPILTADITVLQLQFLAAASGYRLSASGGAKFTLTYTTAINDFSTSGFNLISAPIILGAASGTQAISAASALVITGQISSTNPDVGVSKGGAGTVFLLGANTYTGPTIFSASVGTTVINTIGNVGASASSLGAPTTTLNGTISIQGTQPISILRYVGGTASTDRIIDYAGGPTTNTNSFTLEASGSGALTWAGNFTASGAGTAGKNIWLSGVNSGNNTFSGSIQNGTAVATDLVKYGTGTWVLSGNNTFSGGIYINSGNLVLDYQNGAAVSSANSLTFGNPGGTTGQTTPSSGGTLKLVGKTSGSTAQTLGNLTFNTSVGQNRIVIDPNGGDSTTLTLGDTWTGTTSALLYIELPTNATLASNPAMYASIVGGNTTSGWAVVNTDGVVGYATVDGTSGTNKVGLYTGATPLANNSNGSLNYSLSGSLQFLAGAHALNTLNVNTTGGGTLDLNSTAPTAQSLLFTGTGDYNISNGTIGNGYYIHQYSSGVVTIAGLGSGTRAIAKGGPGTLALTTRGNTGALYIFEGALRANGASVLSAGNVVLSTGGVLELGSVGNFTESLGTTAGTIQFTGDGGFSAYGGDRTVQIGGNTNSIAWGATNFVPNANALVLSGVNSDSTIDFQNGLGLGTQQHVVRVINGSAAVDAKLSGVLSGNYGGGVIKEGAGTLSLTASNTYIGETWVNEGTLLIDGDQSAATGAVTVASGATLGGSGTVGGATTISGTHSPGNSPGIQTFASDLTYTAGASVNWELKSNTNIQAAPAVFDTIIVNGDLDFAGATSLNLSFVLAANGGDVDWSNAFWSASKLGTDGWLLYDVAGTLSNFSNLSLVTIDWTDSFGTALSDVPPSGKSFSLYQDGNDIYLNYVIPEPNTWLLVALGGAAFVVLRRRKSPHV